MNKAEAKATYTKKAQMPENSDKVTCVRVEWGILAHE